MTDQTTDRLANSLAEIRQLQDDHRTAVAENNELRRAKERLEDQVAMLQVQVDKSDRQSKIYMRKLIELAKVQKNIGLLTQDGNEIMMMAENMMPQSETKEEELAEQQSAAAMVSRLPAAQV